MKRVCVCVSIKLLNYLTQYLGHDTPPPANVRFIQQMVIECLPVALL